MTNKTSPPMIFTTQSRLLYYLGIDFGTSGVRAIVINQKKEIINETKQAYSQIVDRNLAKCWQQTLDSLLAAIPLEIRQQLKAIAINGTSATVLLCDDLGKVIGEPLFYHDWRGKPFLDSIKQIAPANHVAISATSSLAKLFWYRQQSYFSQAKYFLHQADWLAFLFHGKLGISDYHNALKLGYDVDNLCYPNWLKKIDFSRLFPQVLAPGEIIATITPKISDRFSLPHNCLVCAGTTDSIAAFLASGASQPGEGVTSLGSTLVLKLLSKTKVTATESGIYSHRFGDLWLTGGASNAGGAVLKNFFSDAELINLSAIIDPNRVSQLDYYPLLEPGERFPVNDPNLEPKLSPRPQNKAEFLHELLSAMAKIEARGYRKLQELGASKLTQIYTAGGGAKNQTWQQIRQQYSTAPIIAARQTEAAYGTALLALSGVRE